MPLSIQDALLLTLIVGSMCLLIVGDISTYLRSRLGSTLVVGDLPMASSLRKTLQKPPFKRAPASVAGRLAPRGPLLTPLPQVADLLVVDDSAVARAKLRRLFAGEGYSVQLACDGVEALALLAKGRYSMMITDLEMPNMDGIALIHECLRRRETAPMPIIAVSAHENLRATFNECRDICGVHRKPWADDILLSHVATLIGTPSHAGVQNKTRARGGA